MKTKVPYILSIVLGFLLTTSAWAQVIEVAYILSEIGSVSQDPDVPATQDLYIIDLDTGDLTFIGTTINDDVDGLAFSPSGVLFGSDNDLDRLVRINRNTGATSPVGSFSGAASDISDTGMSFNSSGTLYLVDDENDEVFTVNTATAELTLVVTLAGDPDISAIAFDSNDVLYAVDSNNDSLVTLDLGDGSVDIVGTLNVPIEDGQEQGLHFDRDDVLYLIAESTESLYRVNTTTGNATFVGGPFGFDAEALAIFEIPTQFQPSKPIPVLPVWAMIIMSLLLGGAGLWSQRRR